VSTAVKKTIALPPDLARDAEAMAKAEGKTLSAIIQEALHEARARWIHRPHAETTGYLSTMPLLSDEHSILPEPFGAVYIDTAKAASSSIKATLATHLGIGQPDGNPHEMNFPRPQPGDAHGERIYPGLYTFAFVRNPWDRLVYCYRDKIRGEVRAFTAFAEPGVAHCFARLDASYADMSLRDFVQAVAAIPDQNADEHFRSQSDYLINASGAIAVDFIGRYETLEQGFAAVARRNAFPADNRPPRLQAARRRPYQAFYTRETRRIVEQRYARDLELFHYEFPADKIVS